MKEAAQMKRISRRRFLLESGKGVIGAALTPVVLSAASQKSVFGANERPNVALIGCGGRGRVVMRHVVEQGGHVTYVCDLHPVQRDKALKTVADVQQHVPKSVVDMREILDSKDVDAVIIGTPDHWHAGATILSCQARKDVYVEKPHSHNIWESRKVIEAARKYNRIVQVGTQSRSAPYNMAAREYVRSGKLGSIHLVKVYNIKPGRPFKLGKTEPPVEGFDWDIWLGPAPYRPYHRNIFSSGWHKYWDFSGGDLADDGIHQLDIAMMLLDNPGMPQAVACSGGRFFHKGDDAEVPDVQIVTYDFSDFVMTLEQTNYPKYMRKTTGTIRRNDEFPYWTQNATRVELYGSDLMLTLGRHGGGWQVTTSGGKVVEQMFGRPSDDVHAKDFIERIKDRKKPNGDVETIHPSLTMVHAANIAHRVGNAKLRFDPKAEKFIDNDNANKLLKRQYRSKYEIPEQV